MTQSTMWNQIIVELTPRGSLKYGLAFTNTRISAEDKLLWTLHCIAMTATTSFRNALCQL